MKLDYETTDDYKNNIANYSSKEKKEINFIDVGVSGGPDGARNGACLMIGGKKEIFVKYEQLFKDISSNIK